MGKIIVTDRDGRDHELDALDGWRVMEIIRDHGLDVEALCGGACSCATCHVYVDEAWSEKLYPRRDDETEMLDEAYQVEPHSRLSCQIIWTPELDGLHVKLAPQFG